MVTALLEARECRTPQRSQRQLERLDLSTAKLSNWKLQESAAGRRQDLLDIAALEELKHISERNYGSATNLDRSQGSSGGDEPFTQAGLELGG